MEIYEDIGYDLATKYPAPIENLTTQALGTPSSNASTDPATPRSEPEPKKTGSGLGWFIFGLFLLGTIGATIYMGNRDGAFKERTEH